MDDEKEEDIGALLLEHFLQYQMKQRRVVQQKEFAEYIGLDPQYYNHIYHGRRKPGKFVVRLLAEFFDDLRFYDAVSMDRPDPDVHFIQSNWKNLPKKIRKQILEDVGIYKMKEDD